MTYVAEENGLGAVEFGEGLRSLSLLLVCARGQKRLGELLGDEAQKITIRIIQRAPRTYARN